MSTSQRIENTTAVLVLFGAAATLWRPNWAWLNWIALGVLFAGLALSFLKSTRADRGRAQRGGWIIPLAALAIALQWVFFADVANRVRAALLGAGLVLVTAGLGWVRRRTA